MASHTGKTSKSGREKGWGFRGGVPKSNDDDDQGMTSYVS